MDKMKRIVLLKTKGLSTRFDYTYLSDEEFENSLDAIASKFKVDKHSIINYTLGDKDQTDEGVVHFCPKCGYYNETGYEPEVHSYYKIDKESNQLEPAGFYKTLNIDCTNCNEVFNINTDQFEAESEKLTETFLENKKKE